MPDFAPYEMDNEAAGTVRYRTVSGERRPTAKATAAKQVLAYQSVTPPVPVPTALDNSYISDFTEAAQDAVGTILVDGTTIDFTYADATPSITAEVKAASITNTYLSLAYTGYTPTITQGGTVTSFSINSARYIQIGKMVHLTGAVTINNAGTAAGANIITISLPVNWGGNTSITHAAGTGALYDASADILYPFSTRLTGSATTFTLLPVDQVMTGYGAGGLALGTLRFTAALATSDQIAFDVHYEAA